MFRSFSCTIAISAYVFFSFAHVLEMVSQVAMVHKKTCTQLQVRLFQVREALWRSLSNELLTSLVSSLKQSSSKTSSLSFPIFEPAPLCAPKISQVRKMELQSLFLQGRQLVCFLLCPHIKVIFLLIASCLRDCLHSQVILESKVYGLTALNAAGLSENIQILALHMPVFKIFLGTQIYITDFCLSAYGGYHRRPLITAGAMKLHLEDCA